MSVAFKGKRSKLSGPWHYCGRCEDKTHIAEMQWQRGKLLCVKCFDSGILPLVGQREQAVAAVLENIADSNEMKPHPKLIEPSEQVNDSDDIIF